MLTSIHKTASILKLFRLESPEFTLSEIVNETGYPKSTVYKILTTLTDSGLIIKDSRKKMYRPSILTFEMGQFYLNQLDLIQEIMLFAKRLVKKTGMAVLIAQYKDGETIWINESSTTPYQTSLLVGRRAPALLTSSGLTILAHLEEKEIKRSFDIQFSKTEKTAEELKVEYEKIVANIELVKMLGFAHESEILEKGVASIAAPLFDYSNIPFGSISIVAEASRLQTKETMYYGKIVKESANEISRHFGYNDDLRYK